jgi:hypothetical protein
MRCLRSAAIRLLPAFNPPATRLAICLRSACYPLRSGCVNSPHTPVAGSSPAFGLGAGVAAPGRKGREGRIDLIMPACVLRAKIFRLSFRQQRHTHHADASLQYQPPIGTRTITRSAARVTQRVFRLGRSLVAHSHVLTTGLPSRFGIPSARITVGQDARSNVFAALSGMLWRFMSDMGRSWERRTGIYARCCVTFNIL